MESDHTGQIGKPIMSDAELVAFVKRELDADDKRQAQISGAGTGDVPHESQTGVTVDLSRKNIGLLPIGLITLIRDKVERLALSHNPRIVLPIEIGQCERLRYLNLRWNKLKQFPEAVFALTKLEILDISKNSIEVIPEDIRRMTNLKFLAVARNQIRRLPLAFGDMNLVKLKFDDNPIEFPPADKLRSSFANPESMPESERDKEICQQVKRFMKSVTIRERARANSEEDLSTDSNVETPRPPKRTFTGGRFPVRPSISGMDQMFPDARSSSSPPHMAPPMPQKSHARVPSTAQPPLRPAIAPLVTGNLDANRSRSETVTSTTSVRSRRQGFVPRKTSSNLGSVNEASNISPYARTARSTHATPSHSRATSSASGFTFLDAGSGGDYSSAAVSPIDAPTSARSMSSRKLFSLPESRNSTQPTINSIKAVKRVLYVLFYLYRPVADIAQQISNGSPQRSDLGRRITTANAQVEELDRLITCVNGIIEENAELDPTFLMSIMRTAIKALQSYALIVTDMSRQQQKILKLVDPFHIRCLLNVSYSTNIESRNICHVLGFETAFTTSTRTNQPAGVWDSRTVTPTQTQHPKNRRIRGPTILPNPNGPSSGRKKTPRVPLYATGPQVHTTSSSNSVATRPEAPMYGAPMLSRSNTLRSVTMDSESEDSPEKGFFKLRACCEICSQALPPFRNELNLGKIAAENLGHSQVAVNFDRTINNCDATLTTCTRLLNKLRLMRVTDPNRVFPDLEQMFKTFSKDWTEFIEEFRALTLKHAAVGSLKSALKPVHAAVKDVARVLLQSQSSGYTTSTSAASRGMSPYHGLSQAPISKFATVPVVTPLGAALGPAAQATVANSSPYTHLDSHQMSASSGVRSAYERNDQNLPTNHYGRR